MNVSCPQCRTVFRVNPAKVPREGVRARCAICGSTFEVTAPASAPEPAAVPGSAPGAGFAGGFPAASTPAPAFRTPPAAPPAPPAPSAPSPPSAPGQAPGQAAGAEPDARAKRLARALVSDLRTYHPDLQERGLREGRLKELFREEIKKSWQQYVDQVGLDVAKSTPHFRDALNEILAQGQRVF